MPVNKPNLYPAASHRICFMLIFNRLATLFFLSISHLIDILKTQLEMKALTNQTLGSNQIEEKNTNSFPVHLLGRILWVQAHEISYLQGEGNYTFICTKSGKRYLVSKNLKTVQETLDADFVRVHKSYMVNPNHVTARLFESIQMSCGKSIPIARRRIRETHEMFAEMEC